MARKSGKPRPRLGWSNVMVDDPLPNFSRAQLDRLRAAGIDTDNATLMMELHKTADRYRYQIRKLDEPTPAEMRAALKSLLNAASDFYKLLNQLDSKTRSSLLAVESEMGWFGLHQSLKSDTAFLIRAINRTHIPTGTGRPKKRADKELAIGTARTLQSAQIVCQKNRGASGPGAWEIAIRVCAELAGKPGINLDAAWRSIRTKSTP
jgi:hypothetical protein